MIPKITKGTRLRGLLEYLWGPGKAEEHTNPRIVAGYTDPAGLSPPVHPIDRDRWDLTYLASKLNKPHEDLGSRGLRDYVLQCSLSLPADDRPVTDEEWQQIAERFIDRMGLSGCRWIAVHHGRSVGGNDHIHLVVTRATEDGRPVYLREEWKEAQRIADELEDEFGLSKRSPGREGATKRPAASRPETDRSARDGLPATDREMLRREVRAALAGAKSEAEWVARMKASGLLVAARTAADDPQQVVGYAVALRPRGRRIKPRWLAGRSLDADLSLYRIRARWLDEPLDAAGWKVPIPAESAPLDSELRIEAWRRSAAALRDITDRLASVPPTSPEWPAIARASADLMSRVAASAEPTGFGPLSRAADSLARAAAPRRRDPHPVASAVANELGRVADALLAAGRARGPREVSALMAAVLQVARLIVALAELREAQQQAAAAGAAAAAAAHLTPVLRAHHPAQATSETDQRAAQHVESTPPQPHLERTDEEGHRSQR